MITANRSLARRAGPIAAILLALAMAVVGTGLGFPGQWADRRASNTSRPLPGGLDKLPARPDVQSPQGLAPFSMREALARNAADPFAPGALTAARPFHFNGSALDRDRALRCLSLAALAEAGNSDAGQRAVIQVVLNRVRHPAFAPTVCGVVFQGSERGSGCQFTFTCDGALARSYPPGMIADARRRADQALNGKVYAPVGTATHYHTDWVYPVWSHQLDKIAQVDTHLFFRWPGYWGSRSAAMVAYRGGEPDPAALIATASSHSALNPIAVQPGEAPPDRQLTLDSPASIEGGQVVARHTDNSGFLVALEPRISESRAISLGRRLCGAQGYCQVWGWTNQAQVPGQFPVTPAARASLDFSYVIDASYQEVIYFNCERFPAAPRDQCLPATNRTKL